MPPIGRRTRQRIKQMDKIQLMEWVIIITVTVIAMAAIVAALALSSVGGGGIKESRNVAWEKHGPDTGMPLLDTDGDGLGDIEENYKTGTNISNPDTDGDGMDDFWEVKYGKKDPKTLKWNVDPNDPTDAHDDPDNDGYDFNNNGYIDGSEQDKINIGYDMVVRSKLKVPAHSDYTVYQIEMLLSNLEEHRGELVRIVGARVTDNGTYKEYLGQPDREMIINITDQSTSGQLQVRMEPRSNRPINLYDDNSWPLIPADIVDVQGIFVGSEMTWEIVVRGTERFTNLMEYLAAQDYDNDGKKNETDPTNWDTDGDLMSDGWEVHYGQGYVNTSVYPPRWEWIVQIDPTYGGDATGEGNPLADPDGDRINLADGRTVGYNMDEYITILDEELLAIVPRNRWNLADILGREEIDRSKFAYGMNPTLPDTDFDSFDKNLDGWTPDDDNCNDFKEIFDHRTNPVIPDTDFDTMWDGWEVFYGLNATNANDRFDDPDGDLLQNQDEYRWRTNPRRWDTDDEGLVRKNPGALRDDPNDPACFDGMPDGWEVFYRLDPLNRADQFHDEDVIAIAGSAVLRPDGLINLYEYYNNTDPKNPDTDGDHLSDFEEVAVGWNVKVNGKWEHYFTCASKYIGVDTDKDDLLKPIPLDEDEDGNSDAGEEYLRDGPDGEPLDNDGDGLLDEEHDLNDFNEITYWRTNASNPDTDGDGLYDGIEIFTDVEPDIEGLQATDPCLDDTDGDGLKDNVEVVGLKLWLPGTAVQQIITTSPLRLDTDNDGLKDGDEVLTDFNPILASQAPGVVIKVFQAPDGFFYPAYDPDIGDQVDSTNPRNQDTDSDGIPDGYEFDNSDLDFDGLPTWWEETFGFFRLRPLLQDTDGNGILDMEEDFDGDGFTNLEEFRHRTDPLNPDSRIPGLDEPGPGGSKGNNGIRDSDEGMLGKDKSEAYKDKYGRYMLMRSPVYSDSDGDHMPDWWEKMHNLNPRANDALDDKDNDGFANLDEYIFNTDPEKTDSNANGIPDWSDHPLIYHPNAVDRDQDGIADWWEKYWFGSIDACDPNANPDGPWDPEAGSYGDNWTNFEEYYKSPAGWEDNRFRTNPTLNDTDGDGINDDADPYPVPIPFVVRPVNPTEASQALNPIRPGDAYGDIDQDGMPNIEEYKYPWGTLDPTDPDSDQDGMPDGWEVAMGIPIFNESSNQSGKSEGPIERIMDPLVPGDTFADPDEDGVNYSLKWVDKNNNGWPDSGEFNITEADFNGDGIIDPFYENESLSNLEEYLFGKDCDADGIMENTTYPFKNDTDDDGMLDGFEIYYSDSDNDGLSTWWELVYGLNPLDPFEINGSLGDPDGDGYTNLQEYQNRTNPMDPTDTPAAGGRGLPENHVPDEGRGDDALREALGEDKESDLDIAASGAMAADRRMRRSG